MSSPGCDYYSRKGFAPEFWGPALWTFLHVVAANYPCRPSQADKARFVRFVDSLASMLPCATCRAHFHDMLRGRFSLAESILKNRFTLFDWTVKLHNAVNRRLGKRVYADTDAWFKMYSAFRAV